MIKSKPISRSGSRDAVLDGHRAAEHASKLVPLESILLRYIYYGFIFTIPFDAVSAEFLTGGSFGDTFAVSKLFGYALLALSLVNPRLCYRRIPAAFVCIIGYFGIYLVLGLLQGVSLEGPSFSILRQSHTFTLIQMIVLFLVSYNLLHSDRIAKGFLWAFAVSCTILAILQAQGITSKVMQGGGQGRVTSVGGDANALAAVLVVGLLILIGLAYGLQKPHWISRVLLILSFGVLGSAIIVTGSRGGVVALAAGLMVFVLRRGGAVSKAKTIGLILLLLCLVAALLLRSELSVGRWTKTLASGDMAAREAIFPVLLQMFLEKPVLGWGPINHREELSRRMHELTDCHNLYLWILTEVGLLGGIPFFLALYIAFRAAWKARLGAHGILPLSLILCVSILNLTGNYHNRKFFWIFLAYALASAALPYLTNGGTTARINRFIPERRRAGTATVWG